MEVIPEDSQKRSGYLLLIQARLYEWSGGIADKAERLGLSTRTQVKLNHSMFFISDFPHVLMTFMAAPDTVVLRIMTIRILKLSGIFKRPDFTGILPGYGFELLLALIIVAVSFGRRYCRRCTPGKSLQIHFR